MIKQKRKKRKRRKNKLMTARQGERTTRMNREMKERMNK